MRIAIVGPYPPPYGGRSIHVKRLRDRLKKEGINVVVYNTGGEVNSSSENIIKVKGIIGLLRLLVFLVREKIIHHHDEGWKSRVIIGLMGLLKKKIIFSVHSSVALKDDVERGNLFKRKLLEFVFQHSSFIIADNEKIKKVVLSLKVKPDRVDTISAFVPPTVKEEDDKKIPRYVWDFMKTHKPLISANAFRIEFYNGVDIYGLDLAVGLVDKLRKKYPKVGLVFCIPDIGSREYFDRINCIVEQTGICENVLFVTEPLEEIYPIWKKSDIFIRPTYIDGDPLSVREALFFEIPVVASDAAPRPNGVVLFKNRDLCSFIQSVEHVLDNYGEYKCRLRQIKPEDGSEKIIRVYKSLNI
jgi:hypothetical protein